MLIYTLDNCGSSSSLVPYSIYNFVLSVSLSALFPFLVYVLFGIGSALMFNCTIYKNASYVVLFSFFFYRMCFVVIFRLFPFSKTKLFCSSVLHIFLSITDDMTFDYSKSLTLSEKLPFFPINQLLALIFRSFCT